LLIGTIVPFAFLLLVLVNPASRARLVVRVSGQRQRALRAGIVRDVGHLSRVLPDRSGRADRASSRMETQRRLHAGNVGTSGYRGGALYLLLMLLNIVWPGPLDGGRAVFNYGWITLLVMTAIVAAGAICEAFVRRP